MVEARDLPPVLVAAGLGAGVAGLALGPWSLPDLLGIAGLAVALALLLAQRRGAPAGRYAAFALRVALALPLLAGGGLLLARSPLLLANALGAAWLAAGLGLALGVLVPWAALYAAFVLALGLPLGSAVPGGFALAALALALVDDDLLALDARLARRGGLFPTMRREVRLRER